VKNRMLFIPAFALSYLIVCGVGLMVLVRPWDASALDYLKQKPDIIAGVLFTLQIPGLAPLAWLFQPSLVEPAIFIFGSYLCVSTVRNLSPKGNVIKLKKLGKMTFIAFGCAIVMRVIYMLMSAPPIKMQTESPYDLRSNQLLLAWLNFESTLMLALVFVHLAIQWRSRRSRLDLR